MRLATLAHPYFEGLLVGQFAPAGTPMTVAGQSGDKSPLSSLTRTAFAPLEPLARLDVRAVQKIGGAHAPLAFGMHFE